jgi:hypothetical protein
MIPEEEKQLLLDCLAQRELRRWTALSMPCPEGKWRWAGPDPVPGAHEKALTFWTELLCIESARQYVRDA